MLAVPPNRNNTPVNNNHRQFMYIFAGPDFARNVFSTVMLCALENVGPRTEILHTPHVVIMIVLTTITTIRITFAVPDCDTRTTTTAPPHK